MTTSKKQSDHGNVVSLPSIPKTNREFLEFVFGPGTRVWTTNFRTNPAITTRGWAGKFTDLPAVNAKDPAQSNTYYCTAEFNEDKRQVDHFRVMRVVVIDDIGTKGRPLKEIAERLRPTYVIETSDGNYQVGYVLDKPCEDLWIASHLINALNDEAGDPSAKGANRVVRLPFGVNTKRQPLWKVRWKDWSGDRYSVEQIAMAFGIDFKEAPPPPESNRGNEEVGEGDFYGPVSLENLDSALAYIEPWELGYGDGDATEGKPSYIQVLQAIHSEHPNDEGMDLAKQWASGELHGVENPRYVPGEIEKRWKGFNEQGNIHGRVTFGTIRMAAIANGWLPPGRDPNNWMADRLRFNKDGSVKITIANCIALIRDLPIKLTFDEFTQRDYLDGELVTDDHIVKVRVLIDNTFSASFGKDMACDAMTAVAKLNSYDALKDYVGDLPPHDGKDYINEMCDLMGIELPIERVFIKRQLISGIARALKPGVKDDTAVVLVGPQGGGKSQFIEALVPVAEWFDDTISGKLSNKDELAKMLGKWQIELAELASLNRSNSETNKQFMSTKIDRFRSPYGRKTKDFPRRCSVWGSTNNPKHLSDETGNRRFWPVNCPTPMAAVGWLRDGNRDLVWAQALALYRAGEQWWLTTTEEDVQKAIAERHRKSGMVEQELEHWWQEGTGPFHRMPAEAKDLGFEPDEDGVYRRHFVQVTEVRDELRNVMKITPTIQQVSEGLKLIGFVPHPTPTGEGKAPTYQYREGGKRCPTPRGFASPRLHAELEPLTNAERGRRIKKEIEHGL